MSKELLTQALLDEAYGIKICYRHTELVQYDEPECPCCRMEYEVRMDKMGRTPLARKQPR